MKILTREDLQNILIYHEDSGLFTWKNKGRGRKKGSIAGTISKGYIKIRYMGTRYEAHRLAWLYAHGVFPDGDIDHINQDRADNRISNLRVVSKIENNKNKGKYITNTTGCTGVYWVNERNRWIARIGVDKKYIHLGCFVEYHEAVNARKNAEVLYGYHENHGKDL